MTAPRRESGAARSAPVSRIVPQGPSPLAAPPPAPLPVPAGEQLHMFDGEQHLLPCNVQVEINYQLRTAIVRRQHDDGGTIVLAHVGGGCLQAYKRWHSHLEPSERTQILARIAKTIGEVKVLK